jgi:hypothetical protein
MQSHGGMILTGESEELGQNLSQYHFVHHKSTKIVTHITFVTIFKNHSLETKTRQIDIFTGVRTSDVTRLTVATILINRLMFIILLNTPLNEIVTVFQTDNQTPSVGMDK